MVGTNIEARIRERAYQIWEREGRPHGRHLEHWRRAEQEVESQADQGILKRATQDPNPAPRMSPSSPAAPAATQSTASEAAGTAKEAKRAVKRKQTQTESKAPRARKPTTKPTV